MDIEGLVVGDWSYYVNGLKFGMGLDVWLLWAEYVCVNVKWYFSEDILVMVCWIRLKYVLCYIYELDILGVDEVELIKVDYDK
jgi:hypothetical protein